jgi:hypothetical protein
MFLIATASPEGYVQLDDVGIGSTFAGIAALWLAFFPPQTYPGRCSSEGCSSRSCGGCSSGG